MSADHASGSGRAAGILAPRWSPGFVATAYFVVGAVWITLSGGVLRTIGDAAVEQTLETVKGIGFAAVSAWLLYALATRLERNARKASRLAYRSGRRADRSAREFEELVALLPEAVLIVQDGSIVYANRNAESLFGHALPGTLAGTALADRVAPASRADVDQRVAAALAGVPVDSGFRPRTLLRRDGSAFEASVGVSRVHLHDRPAVLKIVRDIGEDERIRREAQRAQEESLALSHALIEMQEHERRSIARELHDEIGQSLGAIRVQFAKLQRRVDQPEQLQLLASAATMTERTLGSVRSLSLMLHPPQLETLGLEAALRWHLEEMRRLHDTDIAFCCRALPRAAHPDLAIATYRIVQESVTNALRHAGAGCIAVSVERDDATLRVSVEDDGNGFDVEATRHRRGRPSLGLLGMNERARLLGGRLDIRSGPAGTVVRAELPWRPPEPTPT